MRGIDREGNSGFVVCQGPELGTLAACMIQTLPMSPIRSKWKHLSGHECFCLSPLANEAHFSPGQ